MSDKKIKVMVGVMIAFRFIISLIMCHAVFVVGILLFLYWFLDKGIFQEANLVIKIVGVVLMLIVIRFWWWLIKALYVDAKKWGQRFRV